MRHEPTKGRQADSPDSPVVRQRNILVLCKVVRLRPTAEETLESDTDLVAVVPLPHGVQQRGLGEVGNAHRVGHALQGLRVYRLQIRALSPNEHNHRNHRRGHINKNKNAAHKRASRQTNKINNKGRRKSTEKTVAAQQEKNTNNKQQALACNSTPPREL